MNTKITSKEYVDEIIKNIGDSISDINTRLKDIETNADGGGIIPLSNIPYLYFYNNLNNVKETDNTNLKYDLFSITGELFIKSIHSLAVSNSKYLNIPIMLYYGELNTIIKLRKNTDLLGNKFNYRDINMSISDSTIDSYFTFSDDLNIVKATLNENDKFYGILYLNSELEETSFISNSPIKLHYKYNNNARFSYYSPGYLSTIANDFMNNNSDSYKLRSWVKKLHTWDVYEKICYDVDVNNIPANTRIYHKHIEIDGSKIKNIDNISITDKTLLSENIDISNIKDELNNIINNIKYSNNDYKAYTNHPSDLKYHEDKTRNTLPEYLYDYDLYTYVSDIAAKNNTTLLNVFYSDDNGLITVYPIYTITRFIISDDSKHDHFYNYYRIYDVTELLI